MDGRFSNPFVSELEEPVFVPDITDSLPLSGVINDGKLSTGLSPKKSKRSVQKRVVTVPIADANGSRLKGEGAPPTDSWAWRKYGQKPIKGSPYPRGYYRCSSSKGCPARKQVERSRADPTMLVITYACEHNHSWPASKSTTTSTTTTTSDTNTSPAVEEPSVFTTRPEPEPEPERDAQYADLGEDSMITADDFSWFSDVESTSRTLLEAPFWSSGDDEMTMIFPMREEDELMFADLGELPECSLVFRREQEERRRGSLSATWCESTG